MRNHIYVSMTQAMDYLNGFTLERAGEKPIMDLADTFKPLLVNEPMCGTGGAKGGTR